MRTDCMGRSGIGIYVHIPFCVRKCAYCDFLSFSAEAHVQRIYVDALLREIRRTGVCMKLNTAHGEGGTACKRSITCTHDKFPRTVKSVFFGGGTPSLLPAEWIAEILRELCGVFVFAPDAEITVEANPGTVSAEKLQIYRDAGVSRISFGCQSFQEKELKLLGRIHTVREIRESVQLARKAGFVNINLDLMSGLPGQDLRSWEDTLYQAVSLDPEHISAYSLIIEEGTPFYARYGESEDAADSSHPVLPDEETERRMYERTAEILEEAGYRQYEVSNYAKEGSVCRHNLGYWTGISYFGFGLGASGYLPGTIFDVMTGTGGTIPERVRYRNTCDLSEYMAGAGKFDEIQCLYRKDLQAEFMILGLRLTKGVEDAEYARRFGCTIDDTYGPVLDTYTKTGFLIRENGRTRLSRKGVSVSNVILADFL